MKRKPSREGRRFEEKLAHLEEIVGRLESGEVPLEESLALFEQGTALLKELAQVLDRAEAKVEVLTRTAGGRMRTAPLEEGEEGGEEGA